MRLSSSSNKTRHADKVKNFHLRTKRLHLICQNASFELFGNALVLLKVQNSSVPILSLLFDSLFAHIYTDSLQSKRCTQHPQHPPPPPHPHPQRSLITWCEEARTLSSVCDGFMTKPPPTTTTPPSLDNSAADTSCPVMKRTFNNPSHASKALFSHCGRAFSVGTTRQPREAEITAFASTRQNGARAVVAAVKSKCNLSQF